MKSHRGGNRRLGQSKEVLAEWDRKIAEGVRRAWARKSPEERMEFGKNVSRVYFSKTSEEQRERNRKVSESLRKTWANKTPEQLDRFREVVRSVWDRKTPEERRGLSNKISITVKSIWDSNPSVYGEERNRKIGESMGIVWANKSPEEMEEFKRKMSEIQREVWARLTPEERDEWSRKAVEGQRRKPSMPELLVGMYLGENFPGKWIYNGDGKAGMVIGKKIPDFYNADGKKEVIEVLGGIGYFHFAGDGAVKINHYAKYGYGCIIVWERDCYTSGALDMIFRAVG